MLVNSLVDANHNEKDEENHHIEEALIKRDTESEQTIGKWVLFSMMCDGVSEPFV